MLFGGKGLRQKTFIATVAACMALSHQECSVVCQALVFTRRLQVGLQLALQEPGSGRLAMARGRSAYVGRASGEN
jgi:hypothetical protein